MDRWLSERADNRTFGCMN